MIYNDGFKKKENEDDKEYQKRICSLKDAYGLTWQDIATIVSNEIHTVRSANAMRKFNQRMLDKELSNDESNEYENVLLKIKKERVKLADERTQNNALIRRLSREETLKEIAKESANIIASSKEFNILGRKFKSGFVAKKIGILQISDWHYGAEVDSFWNTYNPEIAKERIINLKNKVKEKINQENLDTVYVINTGDLICGNIHLRLRLNTRIDVITQVIEVSELLAEFLVDLSKDVKIFYADCLDNHSRVTPIKEESLDIESLTRITHWYLQERLKSISNISFLYNQVSNDMIDFHIFNHTICAVHGHKDKPDKIIDNLILMNKQHYDLILTSHLHHFSANEKNETIVLCNSSLMGTDDLAESLRLSAKPSQNFIIVSENNITEAIYRIIVD